MYNFVDVIRSKLLKFLGINDICICDDNVFYRRIATGLLSTYKIFGSEDKLSIGKSVVLNDALINTSSGSVSIGNYSFTGHGVLLITGSHNLSKTSMNRQMDILKCGKDITIGEGVWIGSNAIILGPCHIGDNSVIGAGAVVTCDIECNSVYAGVPAKKINNIQRA